MTPASIVWPSLPPWLVPVVAIVLGISAVLLAFALFIGRAIWLFTKGETPERDESEVGA